MIMGEIFDSVFGILVLKIFLISVAIGIMIGVALAHWCGL